MFVKLNKNYQKKLVSLAVQKAGSERKLSSLIGIPKSVIYFYKYGKRNLSKERFNLICNFLNISFKERGQNILGYLDKNWGRVKGGKNSVKSKIKNGLFKSNIEMLHRISSENMKRWHKNMREENPEVYYKLQYKRFKKVNNKPLLKTKAGVEVRNKYEKEVIDFLFDKNVRFEYEPYLNINGKAYFPDLIVSNNLIIEITAWKHPDNIRLMYLKRKIKDYKNVGYTILFYIPKPYRNFYKEICEFVVSDLNKLYESMPR